MDYIMSLPADLFLPLVAKAVEKRQEDFARQQWLAMLPWMPKDKFVPFEEFFAGMQTKRISNRSKEDILAEAEAIQRAVESQKQRD